MKKVAMFVSILVLTVAVQALPNMINYQGTINVDGTSFTGAGDFKFAIVDDPNSPTESFWSNDSSSVAGVEPSLSVSVSVNNGLYHVVLGETDGMDPIDGSVFSNDDLYLRIWFDDGTNGFQRLAPDQRLTSTGFSFRAETAGDADTVDGMEGADLEESSEIDSDIATHAAIAGAHHAKTTSFTELTDVATDAQIPDDITIDYAATAGDADTVDGMEGTDLEESSEIDSDIATHAAIADAHHAKTTSFTELTDAATDAQIPDDISINNGRLYAPSGTGNVGIGTDTPAGILDVFQTGTEIEISQEEANIGWTTDIWQSFTASQDGYLTEIQFVTMGGSVTEARIYAGEGTTGTLLYTVSGNWDEAYIWHLVDIPIGDVPVTVSQKYTMWLEMANFQVEENTDPYPGGRCSVAPDADLKFRVTINTSILCMLVRNDGNVGIGTSNPAEKLHVIGNVQADDYLYKTVREDKDHFVPFGIEQALTALSSMQPVIYGLENNPSENRFGLITEDISDLISTNGHEGMSSIYIITVLTRILQEQQERISDLERRLEALE